MKEYFEKEYTITQNMLDQYDNLSIEAVLDLFQDVAGNHADLTGVGFNDLLKKDLAWVLARTRYEVTSKLTNLTALVVKTWPNKPRRFDTDRNYLISDDKGKVLVKGASKWAVINIKSRSLSTITDIYDANEEFSLEKNFVNIISSANFHDVNYDRHYITHVTSSMLDHNGHMNNSKYAMIILDALDLKKDEQVAIFEISYHKESKLHEELSVNWTKVNSEIYIEIDANNEIKTKAKITLK